MAVAKQKPEGAVSDPDDSDMRQRIGSSPRLVASISVYLEKSGRYHINLGTLGADAKPIKTRNSKGVLDAVSKFLNTELEKDQWDEPEEED